MEKIKWEYNLARERLQTNMSAGAQCHSRDQTSVLRCTGKAEEIFDSALDKDSKVLIMMQRKGLILGIKTSRR